jgi:hypothetical protein
MALFITCLKTVVVSFCCCLFYVVILTRERSEGRTPAFVVLNRFIENLSCEEAKLHEESKDDREDEGDGGHWRGGGKPLRHGFDKEDDKVERESEDEAVRDEHASADGGAIEDVLEVERRKERKGAEDKEEKDKLQKGGEDFSHGWTLKMSVARVWV